MELIVLDSSFRPGPIIDDFSTAIWTERYTKVGDFVLTASPTDAMRTLLTEGTFVQLHGSDEVAQIDTFSVEDGVLKVTGSMITNILASRILCDAAGPVTDPPTPNKREYSIADIPGNVLNLLVSRVMIDGGSLTLVIPEGFKQTIPNLSIDNSFVWTGSAVQFSVPYGQLLDGMSQIAETYSLGFKIYLASATDSGYSLKFKAYQGRDLTSAQTVNPVVKFSPAMDTLSDIKTLRSIAGYKTTAIVYGADDGSHPAPEIAHVTGSPSIGFGRRVILVFAEDITMDVAGGSLATFKQMLQQRAKDTLANNNYAKVVDGEIVPQSEYQYGVHYGLGDIVELDSGDGLATPARITEYIRAQDNTGERAYPTVSVLD